MPYKITGKDIRKQLAGHYGSYIVVLLIIASVLGFCTGFCGTQLEWKHPLSIILMSLLGITFIVFLVIFFKMIKLRNHYIFKRYGSADDIAESINQGIKNPRYISKNRTSSFAFIITDKFIVSTANYRYYLELKDARYMQSVVVPETKPVVLSGNPVVSVVATAGVNYATQKYASGSNYDFLMIWDDEGVCHEYNIRRDEVIDVMQLLLELAPQIEIKERRQI